MSNIQQLITLMEDPPTFMDTDPQLTQSTISHTEYAEDLTKPTVLVTDLPPIMISTPIHLLEQITHSRLVETNLTHMYLPLPMVTLPPMLMTSHGQTVGNSPLAILATPQHQHQPIPRPMAMMPTHGLLKLKPTHRLIALTVLPTAIISTHMPKLQPPQLMPIMITHTPPMIMHSHGPVVGNSLSATLATLQRRTITIPSMLTHGLNKPFP